MDSIKREKIQAMKKYRRVSEKYYFVRSLILHLLIGFGCSLAFSSPYWLPCLCSSTKQFLLISLPCIWSSFFSPKCLFVVVNVIVIFLVGESRLVGSSSSHHQAGDIYDEYVRRSRSFRGLTPHQQNKAVASDEEKRVEELMEKEEAELIEGVNKNKADEDKEEEEEEEVEVKEVKEVKEEKGRDIGEEEGGLQAEELNKRVEEFIARVNKQRRLEAQLLVCCKA